MEGAKEGLMPKEAEASPQTQPDPLGEAKFNNALNAVNPFAPSVHPTTEKYIDTSSFLGRWAKRILAPLDAKPPQEENKKEAPKTSESLP